jgi:hypothetical protein
VAHSLLDHNALFLRQILHDWMQCSVKRGRGCIAHPYKIWRAIAPSSDLNPQSSNISWQLTIVVVPLFYHSTPLEIKFKLLGRTSMVETFRNQRIPEVERAMASGCHRIGNSRPWPDHKKQRSIRKGKELSYDHA